VARGDHPAIALKHDVTAISPFGPAGFGRAPAKGAKQLRLRGLEFEHGRENLTFWPLGRQGECIAGFGVEDMRIKHQRLTGRGLAHPGGAGADRFEFRHCG